jgi:hypothetical protein
MSDETMNLINQARAQSRSEGIRSFFAKNAKNITRLVIFAIVALIIFFGFKSYQNSQEAKYSEILHKSLLNQQAGNVEEAKNDLKQIYNAKSAPSGVKSLASLRLAAILLEEGNKQDSAKIYLEVSSCRSCDVFIKDLGGLLAVRTWLSDEAELNKDDLSARIEKIENGGKMLRYHIAEQRAMLELQRNNLEKAYKIYEQITKNPESSQVLKARAADGLKMIVAKGYEPKVDIKEVEKDVKKEEGKGEGKEEKK